MVNSVFVYSVTIDRQLRMKTIKRRRGDGRGMRPTNLTILATVERINQSIMTSNST